MLALWSYGQRKLFFYTSLSSDVELFFRVYIELWKRKQSTAAMRWGSSGCEDEEQDREVYKGERIKSPVNGQMITYFPPDKKSERATRALVGLYVFL